MPDRVLPVRPNLEQYKKQGRELLRALKSRDKDALARTSIAYPSVASPGNAPKKTWQLADALFVIAREHGFASWPQFAEHVEAIQLQQLVESVVEPVAEFLKAASVPREGSHASGTVVEAELILARHPRVIDANIFVAAVLGHADTVGRFVQADAGAATTPGGVYGWDPLTYLCFSRYLRTEKHRSDAFVESARILLEAGANANTGWYETIDHPNPRQIIESAIYGAAGIAQNAELTRLLLEFGADPNDEETCYHAAENYDTSVLKVLLESGKLNATSLNTLLVRKADWHDFDGMRLVLEHGADPNGMTRWLHSGLQHALRRDNAIETVEMLLDHGADPAIPNQQNGLSGVSMAAHRGRADVLGLFAERGWHPAPDSSEEFLAALALADVDAIQKITAEHPEWRAEVIRHGGTLLAEFAGNGNTDGVRCLLDLGVSVEARFPTGDGYWDVARDSTALHVAAWRARTEMVKLLIARGAEVNAVDGKGRTALALAVRACVDSYWKARRTPDSVRALLDAGAVADGIPLPCGYEEVDVLLAEHRGAKS